MTQTQRTHKQDANAFYAPELTPRTTAACERAWEGQASTLHFRQAGELGDLCRQLERECGELRDALEEVLRAIEHGGLKNEDGQMPDVFNIRAALAKVPK